MLDYVNNRCENELCIGVTENTNVNSSWILGSLQLCYELYVAIQFILQAQKLCKIP